MKDIDPLVEAVLPDIVTLRHDLHQHPELGYEEYRTARRVLEHLSTNPDLDLRTGVGETGIVATLPQGQIGTCRGAFLASADTFEIDIEGQGTHAAFPHTGIDPVLIASQIVVALQTIVSRNIDPLSPAVVTVGQIIAGTATNVIPSTAQLRGTVRALDEDIPNHGRRRLCILRRTDTGHVLHVGPLAPRPSLGSWLAPIRLRFCRRRTSLRHQNACRNRLKFCARLE